jgi:hypothetical protein
MYTVKEFIELLGVHKRLTLFHDSLVHQQQQFYFSVCQNHGCGNFKDTNPLMSSLLVIFVWGGEAIL